MPKEFDAVLVASGHYHAAKVPDLPGLQEWKLRWPDRVSHSRTYRNPGIFQGQVSFHREYSFSVANLSFRRIFY